MAAARRLAVATVLAVPALAVLGAGVAVAEDGDPLITDRPDFTESAATITRGRIQIEGGYTFTRDHDTDEHAAGELLARFGMTEVLEFRLGINSFVWQDRPGPNLSGFEDMTVGIKARLSDPLPPGSRRPQVAVIVATTIATGSRDLGQAGLQPQTTLAFAWELSERTSVGSNLGYAYLREDGGNRFGELSGSVALGRALGEKLGGYVEYYGMLRDGSRVDDHFVNAGFTWALSADSQLDVRAGAGLNDEAADFFIGAGAAWRW